MTIFKSPEDNTFENKDENLHCRLKGKYIETVFPYTYLTMHTALEIAYREHAFCHNYNHFSVKTMVK